MNRHANDWDKLNGGQKLSKFKMHFRGILRGLKVELEEKCQYAPDIKYKKAYDKRL